MKQLLQETHTDLETHPIETDFKWLLGFCFVRNQWSLHSNGTKSCITNLDYLSTNYFFAKHFAKFYLRVVKLLIENPSYTIAKNVGVHWRVFATIRESIVSTELDNKNWTQLKPNFDWTLLITIVYLNTQTRLGGDALQIGIDKVISSFQSGIYVAVGLVVCWILTDFIWPGCHGWLGVYLLMLIVCGLTLGFRGCCNYLWLLAIIVGNTLGGTASGATAGPFFVYKTTATNCGRLLLLGWRQGGVELLLILG